MLDMFHAIQKALLAKQIRSYVDVLPDDSFMLVVRLDDNGVCDYVFSTEVTHEEVIAWLDEIRRA